MPSCIPTEYNGILFRSRLEARWAFVFHHMGLEYLYEPEAFRLPDGRNYLPDFLFPRLKSWAECKPKEFMREELAAAEGLIEVAPFKKIVLLDGYPEPTAYKQLRFADCGQWIESDWIILGDGRNRNENRFFSDWNYPSDRGAFYDEHAWAGDRFEAALTALDAHRFWEPAHA